MTAVVARNWSYTARWGLFQLLSHVGQYTSLRIITSSASTSRNFGGCRCHDEATWMCSVPSHHLAIFLPRVPSTSDQLRKCTPIPSILSMLFLCLPVQMPTVASDDFHLWGRWKSLRSSFPMFQRVRTRRCFLCRRWARPTLSYLPLVGGSTK